jgi:ActR/RegA family two-component response regulator
MPSDLDAQPAALLLCGEATVPCAVLQRAITDAGFDVVCAVGRWSEAVERIAELSVEAAVIDLALTGSLGVRIVPVLRAAAPGCGIIAISPLENIDLAVLEAGAVEVVHPDDLRPLTAALKRIAHRRKRSSV